LEPERWRQIEKLYHAALKLEGSGRAAFLERACGGDDDLRREVDSLLASDAAAGSFIEAPAMEVAAKALANNPSVLALNKDSVKTGATISHYQILGKLGAGGMGEVYRARDTKLNREVALKVLPEAFAQDAERMARFQREAQVLASLNHPYIAAIYGLEESGDTRALVMELVEGPTLAERIACTVRAATPAVIPAQAGAPGPAMAGIQPVPAVDPRLRGGDSQSRAALPPEEALTIAKQIAEALEAAHDQGIIHRDLKPANVKVRADGTVKVLDFGLAKLAPNVRAIHESPLPDSTTVTATTRAGAIMGTAAYMSPEQARGQAVDRRADIWAFGCVLFEILSARRAFAGETFSDTLAAVIMKDPDWSALPETTPLALQRLLRRCLTKDPKQRLRDIGEARIVIGETLSGTDEIVAAMSPSPVGAQRTPLRQKIAWGIAVTATVAALGFALFYLRPAGQAGRAVIAQILPPARQSFDLATHPALSPDGGRLAFVALTPDNKQQLWVRSLDSTVATPLEGTDEATHPFWSPDGRYIGFFAARKLKKIEVSGGPPVDLCDAALGNGGSWAPDGTILFTPSGTSPLYRVPASGGQPVPVTALDQSRQEAIHFGPQFLPDNRHFLFYAHSLSVDFSGTYVGSLEGGKPVLLLRGSSSAVYAPPGYLLFAQEGRLMAQRFNPSRLELTGDPMAITQPTEGAHNDLYSFLTASQNGVLAYGTEAVVGMQMQWFDRDGKPAGGTGGTQIFYTPRLSPDGKELAVTIAPLGGPSREIWVYDLARGVKRRLTFDQFHDWTPVWSSDGTKLAFSSNPKEKFHIYQKSANGTGTVRSLIEDDATEYVDSWSSDGRYLAYGRSDSPGKPGWDIWILPLFGDAKPFPFLQSEFNKEDPSFSPDGKWLAYDSDESGKWEVYIVPFPRGDGKWQVSTEGAEQPRWRGDGKELFYLSGDNKLIGVEVQERNCSLEIGNPKTLFQSNSVRSPFRTYDVTSDGKKFVIITSPPQQGAQSIMLVVNWPALLKNQ
jgi:eukaryotic-like serine/threonine-protein kinase